MRNTYWVSDHDRSGKHRGRFISNIVIDTTEPDAVPVGTGLFRMTQTISLTIRMIS